MFQDKFFLYQWKFEKMVALKKKYKAFIIRQLLDISFLNQQFFQISLDKGRICPETFKFLI